MSDLLEKAEQHEFPFKDVFLCMKPRLITERDAAMAHVAAAQRQKTKPTVDDDRLATPAPATLTSPAVAEAIAEVTRLNDEIQKSLITLRIVGVDRQNYHRFQLANPPRRGKSEVFDGSTFFMYVARQTALYVDDNGDTHPISDEEWAVLDPKGGGGIIGDGEHDRIAEAVIEVNRTVGATDVRFFANVSETTPDSSETSD
jgi:hypothetical protein